MSRGLLRTNAFVRAAARRVRKQPSAGAKLQAALATMAKDIFDPRLKTHRLKGAMEGCYACSAGYDLRIVFRLVDFEGQKAVLLLSVGTHEEVY